MRVHSYRDLIAWQKAIERVTSVDQGPNGWPRDELSGLTKQRRGAAVSRRHVRGTRHGRFGPKAYLPHLSLANGSLFVGQQTHLVSARNLEYSAAPPRSALLARSAAIGRLIHGLLRSLRPAALSPAPYPLTPAPFVQRVT